MTDRKSLLARMEPGSNAGGQSSTNKNAVTIYKDINQNIGRVLQMCLDMVNMLFHSKYQFPKGMRHSGLHSKRRKGKSLF